MSVSRPLIMITDLFTEARAFAQVESLHDEPTLYGVTDGKKVGTYLERKFQDYLRQRYTLDVGNAASGIDLPGLNADIKVTSITQPQSSCPFTSASQKVYGLGYAVLVFVYDKRDDPASRTARLNILHVIYVEAGRTGDYQMTTGLRQILANDGNEDDLVAFMQDKNLPVDDMTAHALAEQILNHPPEIGYLTISNALQWRLQYGRVIAQAGTIDGIKKVL